VEVVLNWLWQGIVVAAAATALLAQTRGSARARYMAWWLALAFVAALPAFSIARMRVPMAGGEPAKPAVAASAQAPDPLIALPDRWWASDAVAIGIWAGWATVHALWLANALLALRRARKRCQPMPRRLETELTLWTGLRSSGRQARLALSNGVQAAAVLGGRSPVVALSPALLDDLSSDEIDCIVAHEWAHVQRRDDMAALVQALVRVVAGWHPAVWWLNRQITLEREHACDEAVVEITGAAKRYAACLVKLAGPSIEPVRPLPIVAMSAAGLRPRVVRILAGSRHRASPRRRLASAVTAAAVAILATAVSGIRLIEAAAPSAAEALNAQDSSDELRHPAGVSRPPMSEPEGSAAARLGPTSRAGASTALLQPSIAARSARATATPSSNLQSPVPDLQPGVDPTAPGPHAEALPGVPARHAGFDTLATAVHDTRPAGAVAEAVTSGVAQEPTPWGAAADAGIALGRGSQRAATATAGFFTRVSKKIAGSF
jgi:beta-lactamase regulating signal transducer with metallopeptidase domain